MPFLIFILIIVLVISRVSKQQREQQQQQRRQAETMRRMQENGPVAEPTVVYSDQVPQPPESPEILTPTPQMVQTAPQDTAWPPEQRTTMRPSSEGRTLTPSSQQRHTLAPSSQSRHIHMETSMEGIDEHEPGKFDVLQPAQTTMREARRSQPKRPQPGEQQEQLASTGSLKLDLDAARMGILYREILDRPLALRKR